MIKKYGIGFLALITAICAAAFTKPSGLNHPLSTKIFEYQPPSTDPFSQANVENRANWAETSLSSTTCNKNLDRACQLVVDQSFINPDHTLKSTFMIQASQALSGNYYVSGGSATAIDNKN
jgi:hypothetical protein